MTQPVITMTVEHLARVLGKLNISFNTQATVSFMDRHNIERVKRTLCESGTYYNFLVSYDSFKDYLTSLGMSENDALELIHGKHFIQK